MSRDYPMGSEEHYKVYFQHDAIDWESLEVTHSQLLGGSSGVEWSLMTDTQLGARIRRVKEEDIRPEELAMGTHKEWHRFDEEGRYMSDYTAQELGAEWRQKYQDSYYSQ